MFSSQKRKEPGSDTAVTPFKIHKNRSDHLKLLADQGFVLAPDISKSLGSEDFATAEDIYERYTHLLESRDNEYCATVLKLIQVSQGNYVPFYRAALPDRKIAPNVLKEYLKSCIVLGNKALAEKIMDRGTFPDIDMIALYCKAAPPNFALAGQLLEAVTLDENNPVMSFTTVAHLLKKHDYLEERLFFIGSWYKEMLEELTHDLGRKQQFIRTFFEDICKDFLMNNDDEGYAKFVAIYEMLKPKGLLRDTIFYVLKKGNIEAVKLLKNRQEFFEDEADTKTVRALFIATADCSVQKGLAISKFLVEECHFQPDAFVVECLREKRAGQIADYLESKIPQSRCKPS